LACALVTVDGDQGRRTVRLRPNAAVALEAVPVGIYRIKVVSTSGFTVVGTTATTLEVKSSATETLMIKARRTNIKKPIALAPAKIASPASAMRQFARGLGWLSKPLAIRVRVGDGGSYHCEFAAPDGLHVTRAKLVSDVPVSATTRGRELDLVLSSGQKAHLYAPWDKAQPSAGYVFLNLRPRVETVARPAFLTALIALASVLLIARSWDAKTGFSSPGLENSSAVLILLLGTPSALAAYFAQAVPSRVTNSMLYGLRLAALVPGLLSVICGAIVITGKGTDWGDMALQLVIIGAVAAVLALGATAWLAEHPREQGRTDRDQGEGFELTYSLPDDFPPGGRRRGFLGRTKRSWHDQTETRVGFADIFTKSVPDDESKADDVRLQMMGRAAGLSQNTRRMLLGQKVWWSRKRQEIPPALYFDSAETPPTYPCLVGTQELDPATVVS